MRVDSQESPWRRLRSRGFLVDREAEEGDSFPFSG